MTRSDTGLVALVLLAVAAALAAPVAGRGGLPRLADALLVLATACGTASFALAALNTWRAARRVSRARREKADTP